MAEITAKLVRGLIDDQFPQWKGLPIRPVAKSGHDNRTFHLGDRMAVRLPSHERYAAAVEKEMEWLPVFARHLTLPITVPVAKGTPTAAFPYAWSVNCWIDGETAAYSNVRDLNRFALDLAGFLKELEAVDTVGGIPAGVQNFHRGGDLAVYDGEAREAIQNAADVYDPGLLTEIWERALAAEYPGAPVWIHGDIAVGNLLVKHGRLCGVIDFGTMGVGDPSSDLVIAWNFLEAQSRLLFFAEMGFDRGVVARARGWALWKALISYDRNEKTSELALWGERVIHAIVEDYRNLC